MTPGALLEDVLTTNISLTQLDLSHNNFQHETGMALARGLAETMAPIIFLRLGFNPIGEVASLAIVEAVQRIDSLAFLGIENGCVGSPDGDDSVQRVWEESKLFVSELHRGLNIEVEYPTRRRKFKFKKGKEDNLDTALIADEGEGHDAHAVSVVS